MDDFTTEYVKVRDLRPGDMVDLEGDEFADPKRDNASFEYELQRVIGTELETPHCIRVDFDGACIGFPPEHELPRVTPVASFER